MTAHVNAIVSGQLNNPHDAAAVTAALIPVILVVVLLVVGAVFAFVVRSAGKPKDGAPPKEKP